MWPVCGKNSCEGVLGPGEATGLNAGLLTPAAPGAGAGRGGPGGIGCVGGCCGLGGGVGCGCGGWVGAGPGWPLPPNQLVMVAAAGLLFSVSLLSLDPPPPT